MSEQLELDVLGKSAAVFDSKVWSETGKADRPFHFKNVGDFVVRIMIHSFATKVEGRDDDLQINIQYKGKYRTLESTEQKAKQLLQALEHLNATI